MARGDIKDIHMTNILLGEVGRFGAEDKTGRSVLIPNSVIFDQAITRYGDMNDIILGEVETTITYDSNLEKTKKVLIEIAESVIGEKGKPHIRVGQEASGIKLQLRYQVEVEPANRLASEINEQILAKIKNEPDMDIAYNRLDVNIHK